MLIDTNIFISGLSKQNDYLNSRLFLKKIGELEIEAFILDFALYSASVILNRRKEENLLQNLIYDIQNNFTLYRPSISEILEANSLKIKLDFDDRLHYHIAKKKGLTLISYDADFDKTDIKRITPKQALNQLEFY